MKNVIGIIPARYASSRLPGKPLADIAGKPMIQHVYERAAAVLPEVLVATDDARIADAVRTFGGAVQLTGAHHQTGTNRCLEAYQQWGKQADIIINIQGDEPLLHPEHLQKIVGCFEDTKVEMASLAIQAPAGEILKNGEAVYLVMDKYHNALYFSRAVIPFIRDAEPPQWTAQHPYYKHLGMYAFRPHILEEFAALPVSALEDAEKLEQNRWLENGGKIRMAITDKKVIAVDTAADLEKVRKMMI